ncbi:hypothetical protein F3Y22_tig00110013pilonHSYRG00554 [Hibiscus syriacus]|uniref:MULE transposase domain-containing protein n=1 Tax=Hibiscus syriacus TaxID=106335 RepID=A0A6A3BRN1_HIBSY|nr:hypothetical protein F3Y22_tig00110013pilonHSYRG00554 [Hibiscus syriacus]
MDEAPSKIPFLLQTGLLPLLLQLLFGKLDPGFTEELLHCILKLMSFGEFGCLNMLKEESKMESFVVLFENGTTMIKQKFGDVEGWDQSRFGIVSLGIKQGRIDPTRPNQWPGNIYFELEGRKLGNGDNNGDYRTSYGMERAKEALIKDPRGKGKCHSCRGFDTVAVAIAATKPVWLSDKNKGDDVAETVELDDDEPTEKIVNTSQYSKFDLGQYPDFDLAAAEEDVVDDNEEEVTTVNEHVEHSFCNSYNPEEEKEEEEIPEEKSPKKMPREVYRGHEIMTDMNARFKISISYSQAWRAKCYALELLRGSPEASFAQLPAYCHNLKLKNPGSVTHIKTDRDGRFELLFISIGVAVNLFVYYLHAPSYYIVDGAHLKGRYLGVNLLAVVMDANNEILPIAYGVGKSETSDSWTWFMGHLRDCIGPISNLTTISDRANSIDNAVRRCFPDAFHGLCGVHLYRNLKSRTAVALHINQDDSSAYAMDCYTTEVYRKTYVKIIYSIPHPSEWDIPDDLQIVFPPAMDRMLPGRPKSHDRIPSKGEEKKRSTYSRCKESGHTRLTCGSPVPSYSSFPLPKYGSSSKSKAHMVSSKRQSKSKSQSQPASPFGTINLGNF